MVYHKFSWLKKPNLSHFEATPKVGASRSPEVHPLEFPNFWTSFSLRKTGRSFQHRRPVAGAAWRAHETLGLLGGKLEVTSCNWSCDLRSISTDQSLQQCNENFVLSGLRRFFSQEFSSLRNQVLIPIWGSWKRWKPASEWEWVMWSGNTQALIFRAVLWLVSAHQGRRKDTKDQAPSMVEKIGSTLILGVTRFGVAIHIDTGCHTSECHICHI